MMKGAERFALTAGSVGLITDGITLLILVTSGTASEQESAVSIELIMISMVYAWLLVSWMLVRRRLSHVGIKDIQTDFLPAWAISGRAVRIVAGIGVLLLPLQMLVFAIIFPPSQWEAGAGDWTFSFILATITSVAGTGLLILWALILLMPAIYRDIP
jgi:hypothetical protein